MASRKPPRAAPASKSPSKSPSNAASRASATASKAPKGQGTRKAPNPKGVSPGGFVIKGNARYDRHDHYYKLAKAEGFAARSVYKLEEIDVEHHLIRKGDVVVDLGCAPGSWLQYVESHIGPTGRAFGVDLLPVKVAFSSQVRVIQGDAFKLELSDIVGAAAGEVVHVDVVLSDMAPNTTGIRSVDADRSMALCERALDVAERLLKPGGHFVVKVLEGGEMKAFVERAKTIFSTVKIRRPKSTREGSTETFVIGVRRRIGEG
jgi:23S rRNA (uridine2552-2'-O)-methyltransferase